MFYKTIRAILFCFPPEIAHKITLNLLKFLSQLRLLPLFCKVNHKPCVLFNLKFKNPVGLAAGLDKNADYIHALFDLGFGFIEVGTVTVKPQTGNPKPRLFRLPEHQALINRMGLNNKGLAYFMTRLKQRKRKYKGILGVSIAKNNHTVLKDATLEYLTCFQQLYPYTDYISLDISCPNVPDSSDLSDLSTVESLLINLKKEQKKLCHLYSKYVPLLVKISPDVSQAAIQNFAQIFLKIQIDGVIATNTTQTRPDVADHLYAKESGGLSGKPLFNQSLRTLQALHPLLQNKVPIVAVGGIMSALDAQKMFDAGASLVQIYTGLIYEGPRLISNIVSSGVNHHGHEII